MMRKELAVQLVAEFFDVSYPRTESLFHPATSIIHVYCWIAFHPATSMIHMNC